MSCAIAGSMDIRRSIASHEHLDEGTFLVLLNQIHPLMCFARLMIQ